MNRFASRHFIYMYVHQITLPSIFSVIHKPPAHMITYMTPAKETPHLTTQPSPSDGIPPGLLLVIQPNIPNPPTHKHKHLNTRRLDTHIPLRSGVRNLNRSSRRGQLRVPRLHRHGPHIRSQLVLRLRWKLYIELLRKGTLLFQIRRATDRRRDRHQSQRRCDLRMRADRERRDLVTRNQGCYILKTG